MLSPTLLDTMSLAGLAISVLVSHLHDLMSPSDIDRPFPPVLAAANSKLCFSIGPIPCHWWILGRENIVSRTQ